MKQTHSQTKQLSHYVLRVPKDEAFFVYFTLESSEGMAFFSTLDESLKREYRDIDVKLTPEWEEAFEQTLGRLQEFGRVDILLKETIQDS